MLIKKECHASYRNVDWGFIYLQYSPVYPAHAGDSKFLQYSLSFRYFSFMLLVGTWTLKCRMSINPGATIYLSAIDFFRPWFLFILHISFILFCIRFILNFFVIFLNNLTHSGKCITWQIQLWCHKNIFSLTFHDC